MRLRQRANKPTAHHGGKDGHDQWRLASIAPMKQHAPLGNASELDDHRSDDPARLDGSRRLDDVTPDSMRRGRTMEIERLSGEIDELREKLDHANRRISRLTGERNQLANLLDKRDAQFLRLNQELGSRPINREPTDEPSLVWWGRLRSRVVQKANFFAERLGRSTASLPSDATAIGGSVDRPGKPFGRLPLVARANATAPRRVLAIVIFGLTEPEIVKLLPVIERDCQARGMMPLLLTDSDAFELFRKRSMIFEYLPPADDRERFGQQLRWDLYLQRRLALIRQKWQPTRIIAFGEVALGILQLWQESPFEESALPAAVSN